MIQNYKILILQNNNFTDLHKYLTLKGLSVTSLTQDALTAKLEELNFDLVMLDAENYNNIYDDIKLIRKSVPKVGIAIIGTPEVTIEEAVNAGADLYFDRPFYIDTAFYSILALLKRTGTLSKKPDYTIGNYTFTTSTLELTIGDYTKKLSKKSAKLLELLCIYKNSFVPRPLILKSIWLEDNYFNGRSLDVFVTHLRKDLSLDSNVKLITEREVGLMLQVPE